VGAVWEYKKAGFDNEIESWERKGDLVTIKSQIADRDEAARTLNEMKGDKHIGCLLLATDTPSVDNGDGTYTHTYMTHQLRYIDPRITHTHDDRQAKPM